MKPFAASFLFLLLLTPVLVAGPAAADLLCRPDYDWSVEVDGAYPQGACFYKGEGTKKWFIDIPAYKDGLLLDLEGRRVVAVPRGQVNQAGDGSGALRVKDNVTPGGSAFAFSVEGPVLQFQTDQSKVRILPVLQRPPITGSTTIGELEADRPEYREGMKAYQPEASSIAVLSKYAKPVEIEAYFATWCSHCKLYMPKFLKVIKEAKNPKIKLDLFGMPKNFSQAQGPWTGKNVTSVPTIIVKIEGREITRMGAHEGAVPETELAGILQAVK